MLQKVLTLLRLWTNMLGQRVVTQEPFQARTQEATQVVIQVVIQEVIQENIRKEISRPEYMFPKQFCLLTIPSRETLIQESQKVKICT